MRVYFRHRSIIDWVVALFAALLLLGLNKFGAVSIKPQSIDTRLFLTTATISATLLGFSLASASFLVSHTNSEGMKFLRESQSFAQLIFLLQSALWRFFGLSVISLVTFVTYRAMPTFSFGLFVTFSVASALAAVTLIWSVSAILRVTK